MRKNKALRRMLSKFNVKLWYPKTQVINTNDELMLYMTDNSRIVRELRDNAELFSKSSAVIANNAIKKMMEVKT